jgi:hypothetical protein
MADKKENRDGRDRSRVSSTEEYELRHVAQKFNVSTDDVRKAIEAVGNEREKIEEYLKGKNRP